MPKWIRLHSECNSGYSQMLMFLVEPIGCKVCSNGWSLLYCACEKAVSSMQMVCSFILSTSRQLSQIITRVCTAVIMLNEHLNTLFPILFRKQELFGMWIQPRLSCEKNFGVLQSASIIFFYIFTHGFITIHH